MSRPLRIEFPGAVYHVTSRGNARSDIFRNDGDRERFLAILGQVVRRFGWLCHGYCLMDNHYHLLVETPEGNLSRGMRQLNGVYTQAFNRVHDRDGHVFRGRFKAILVEKENHLLEVCRYVVLNPIRAGLVRRPETFAWSSCAATLGLARAPDFLTTEWVLANFGGTTEEARWRYRRFLQDGMEQAGSPWKRLHGQSILGDAAFVRQMRDHLASRAEIQEVPRGQRHVGRPPLEEIFAGRHGSSRAERNRLIRRAHEKYGYTLKEISRVLGLHYTTISKVVNHPRS